MDPRTAEKLDSLRNRVSTCQWREQTISRNLKYANHRNPGNSEVRVLLEESAYRTSVLQDLATKLKRYYRDGLSKAN